MAIDARTILVLVLPCGFILVSVMIVASVQRVLIVAS
jgi:hypothetical protein